jgi:ABC-type antimicrobial peptide transport system permease subunit
MNSIFKSFGLATVFCLPVGVLASDTSIITDDKWVAEYEQLLVMRNYSPDLFDVALDINYTLSTKCGFVVAVSDIAKISVFETMMAIRVQSGKSEQYFKLLQSVDCTDIGRWSDVSIQGEIS